MADLEITGIGDASLIASGGSALVYRACTDDASETAEAIDTTLPAPDDPPVTAPPAAPATEPTLASEGDDTTEADSGEIIRFSGDHFTAEFPAGWTVSHSDRDVGHGYRSDLVAPDMYLSIDTTPGERRTTTTTIAQSAREIGATVSTASAVQVDDCDDLTLYSFTFRNNRGIDSIDIFFGVDGNGCAIVAGSNTQTEAVFDVARTVARSIRSHP